MTTVRLAHEGDIPAINALSNWAIRETVAHFGYDEEPDEAMERQWLGTREMYPWLVCEAGGAFQGYAKAGPWRTRRAYAWSAEVTVYVHPDHHRKGVGRALYERLFAILRAQGYRTLLGGITLPNEGSVALHEAMGMRKVADLPRVGFKFGSWHDVGFWALELVGSDGPPRTIQSVDSVSGEASV